MLRRDFLKFLGIAGIGASLPCLALGKEPRTTEKFEDGIVNSGEPLSDNYKKGLKLDFAFYAEDIRDEEFVTVWAENGNFEWTENTSFDYIHDRGELLQVVPIRDYYDFDLFVKYNLITDDEIVKKIKDKKCFNLIITIDDEQYMLDECYYECLEWDLTRSEFSIQGRTKSLEIYK